MNAFGSVHHQLISFTLKHYHAPSQFVNLVEHNTDLFASVSTKSWFTSAIPLKKGVFQGDPLSVEIFNNVHRCHQPPPNHLITLRYKFSGTDQTLGLLQYADDTCLVTNGPSSCKEMLRLTEKWLKWSGMKPTVRKCQCIALEPSTSQVFDPNLCLDGEKIPFVGKNPVRLGGTIQIPSSQQLAKNHIQQKLASLLS